MCFSLDKQAHICYNLIIANAPLAQLVEQLTLNQWVLGSSPRWCTNHGRPVGQAVKTPPSHGGITSSSLVRVTIFLLESVFMAKRFHLFPFRTQQLSSFAPTILGLLDLGKLVNADTRAYEIYALRYSSIAQSVEHAAVNRRVVGSSPTGGAS